MSDISISRQTAIKYTGKLFSLNDLYSLNSWHKRHSIKVKYKGLFGELIRESGMTQGVKEFELSVEVNGKLDTDNYVGMCKVFVDTLKDEGFIIGDTTRYYKKLTIKPNTELPKDSILFNIKAINYDD